jgi:hypothetical protein
MGVRVPKETLKIASVEDFHNAIQYFDNQVHDLADAVLTFPDGLRVASLTCVERTFEDGTTETELVLSDVDEGIECPWP